MLTHRFALTSLALVLSMAQFNLAAAADKKPAPPTTKVSAKVASSSAEQAQLVKVENAWVRPMVKGQTASGGFMVLTASQDLTLVGFATPVAGSSELHEMAMDGTVMRMRAIDALKLPAGQAVTLRPGAHHLMLMDVKQPLKEGDEVALTLKLKSADGKELTQEVKVPVKAGQMMMGGGPGHGAGAHQGMHDKGGMHGKMHEQMHDQTHDQMHEHMMHGQPASAAK
jgi:copper(I)-binding protein